MRSVFPPRTHGCWRVVLFVLACGLATVLLPAQSPAVCPPPPSTSPLEPGEVGLFFDAAGTTRCAQVVFGTFVPLYLVGRAPEGGVASYAVSELLAPASVMVSTGSLPAGAPFRFVPLIDACNTAERIDAGNCPAAEGDLVVLAVYQAMFFTTSGTVCFQTACPTIAGTLPMNPFYERCDAGTWSAFTGGESMCLGLGQAPVPADLSSWGRIKSLYSGD